MNHLKNILPACLIALSAGGATPAFAESSPYYFGGGLGLTRVSNIYREAGAGNSDTIATATLLAGLDQRFGRERLFGDVSLQDNRYASNSDLNNQSYSLKAGLDFATVERISGTLSGNTTRALAAYNVGNGVAPIFKKNIEDNNSIDAVIRLGLVTRYSLEAGAGYRSRSFSADEYARVEYRQKRASFGLVYRPSSDLRLGVAARHTRGKFPRYSLVGGVFQASEYKRNDIDLTGRWVLSGASNLDGRLSTGKSTQTTGVGRDSSSVTGQLTWNWQPTARWSLSTTLIRDTGLETSFFNSSIGNLTSDQNRLMTALQLNGSYELTSKIVLNAGASLNKTDRINEFLDQRLNDYDRDTTYNLSARYQYSRGVQFSCQLSHQARNSSTPQYVYSANSYGCSGQLIIN